MLEVISTSLEGVKIIVPRVFADARGTLSETYNKQTMFERGFDLSFVQDNQTLSLEAGTIRGLHYQIEPFGQHKLVRVITGSIFDVAVDLRHSSPTFGKWASAVLSADNNQQMLVPPGFAHGFCTLQPNSIICYKMTSHYTPSHEHGVAWDDRDLAIAWPACRDPSTLSAKDRALPGFSALPRHFG